MHTHILNSSRLSKECVRPLCRLLLATALSCFGGSACAQQLTVYCIQTTVQPMASFLELYSERAHILKAVVAANRFVANIN